MNIFLVNNHYKNGKRNGRLLKNKLQKKWTLRGFDLPNNLAMVNRKRLATTLEAGSVVVEK